MDKPVRQAAPYFSQPVRQITLMLMVTVLVAVSITDTELSDSALLAT